MKHFSDISWGVHSAPNWEKSGEQHRQLVNTWREWNSDYLIGVNAIKSSNKDVREFGERVVTKCSLEMSKICKELHKIRSVDDQG